mgnify:CR=1 FL=1|jgi:hypothetical protein
MDLWDCIFVWHKIRILKFCIERNNYGLQMLPNHFKIDLECDFIHNIF